MIKNIYWIVPKGDYYNIKSIEKTYEIYSKSFKDHNVNFSFIPIKKLILGVNTEPYILYDNNNLLNEESAFIVSSSNLHAQSRAYSSVVKNMIKLSQAKLLNLPIAGVDELEEDKIAQIAFVSQLGIPVLNTRALSYNDECANVVQEYMQTNNHPLIFKPNSSGMGFGILKSNSFQQSMSIANITSATDHVYSVMPFINGVVDIRLFFIEGELIFLQQRIPPKDDFLANVSSGASSRVVAGEDIMAGDLEVSKQNISNMLELSNRIISQAQTPIISIDWLLNKEALFFNEMSTAQTGLARLPDKITKTVFSKLISYASR